VLVKFLPLALLLLLLLLLRGLAVVRSLLLARRLVYPQRALNAKLLNWVGGNSRMVVGGFRPGGNPHPPLQGIPEEGTLPTFSIPFFFSAASGGLRRCIYCQ